MNETGLVRMTPSDVLHRVQKQQDMWDSWMEDAKEVAVRRHMNLNSNRTKWFGLVKLPPVTYQESKDFIEELYGDKLQWSFKGQRYRNHEEALCTIKRLCDVSIDFVYLSGAQINTLTKEPQPVECVELSYF